MLAMQESGDMRSRVEGALNKVRPALQADGGDARIADFDERRGSVSIEMLGACRGCPLSRLDFVYAIESLIRREVPEVEEILAV
jgi:Fe-S cluster biogenesis protein NfuA